MLIAAVRNGFAAHPSREAVEHALGLACEHGLMEIPLDRVASLGLHFDVTDRLFDAHLSELFHDAYSKDSRYRKSLS